MSRRVLLDADGVMLNWMAGMRLELLKSGIATSSPEPSCYNLTGWVDLSKEEIDTHILNFSANPDSEFSNLPAYDGVAESLLDLRSAGYELVVITKIPNEPGIVERRERNLISRFGAIFEDIICTGHRTSKEPFLRRYDPTHFIEDDIGNALIGRQCGHESHLIQRSYTDLAAAAEHGFTLYDSVSAVAREILQRDMAPLAQP